MVCIRIRIPASAGGITSRCSRPLKGAAAERQAVGAIRTLRRSQLNKWVRLAVLIAVLNITAPSLLACECGVVKVKTTKKARQDWFKAFDGALFIGTVESVEPVAV